MLPARRAQQTGVARLASALRCRRDFAVDVFPATTALISGVLPFCRGGGRRSSGRDQQGADEFGGALAAKSAAVP